jgi:peptidyl-prolyl cis-trans isomerase A (cyclophilin A)
MRAMLAACVIAAFPLFASAQDGATPKDPPAPFTVTAKPAEPPRQEEKLVYVKLSTSMGDIVLELDNEKAPISVKNFLAYTDKGHYDGTVFHRVIPSFMIQGGGFTADLKQKPTDAPIKNEWKNGLKNKRGTVAMARTRVADSATSQFFINVTDNAFLDEPRDGAGYAVFGRVFVGMDVADRIKGVATTTRDGMGDVPVEPVTITKASRMTREEAQAAKDKSETR